VATKRKPLDPQEAIKRLLILSLIKQGATSDEIGKVLGVGGSQIRNLLASGNKKKRG
jgi:hypothetical protein